MSDQAQTGVRMVRLGADTYLHAVDLLAKVREIAAEHRARAQQAGNDDQMMANLAVAVRLDQLATEIDLALIAVVSKNVAPSFRRR